MQQNGVNMIRIAIDGPGGAGKSSLAKAVAKRLGIIYVDTGALYRTIGVYMLNKGIDPSDEEAVAPLLSNLTIDLKFEDGKQLIYLCGNVVGEEIRTPEASMAASAVSALPKVREFLLMTQRNIAKENSVIMDGRDIGTVILPHAEVKIFLTANPRSRAKRRYEELLSKGIETTYEKVFEEMVQRDKNDSTRAVAPCLPAKDAIMFDNSALTADETTDAIISIIKQAEKKRRKRGTPFYLGCKYTVGLVYRLFTRVNVIGKENIPKEGGSLICCNHIGVNDIFLLGVVFPRQIHFLAKKEWFKFSVLKSLFKALGAIELDRGGKDVGALKNAIQAIEEGKLVAIFPQGHRQPGVNPAETPIKSGAGLIAYRSEANIIPVCIRTKDVKYRFMRQINVIIGKPIKNSDLEFKDGGPQEYYAATDKIFAEICRLGDYSLPKKALSGEDK